MICSRSGSLVIVDSFNLVIVALAHVAVHLRLERVRRVEELRMLERRARCAGHQIEQRLIIPSGAQRQIRRLDTAQSGARCPTGPFEAAVAPQLTSMLSDTFPGCRIRSIRGELLI